MLDPQAPPVALGERRQPGQEERGALCFSQLGLPQQSTEAGALNQTFVPHGSRSWKPKIKVSASLISPEGHSLLGLQTVSSRGVLTWPFLWAFASLVALPLLERASVLWNQSPPL